MNSKWRTYKGAYVDVWSIDHQHFSNVYWHNIIFRDKNVKALIPEYRRALEKRFNGEILPYKPPLDFKYEINYLINNKMLRKNGESIEIVFKGEVIGHIF